MKIIILFAAIIVNIIQFVYGDKENDWNKAGNVQISSYKPQNISMVDVVGFEGFNIKMTSGKGASYCMLSAVDAGQTAGFNVCSSENAFKWRFVKGYIQNLDKGLCLDNSFASIRSGNPVYMFYCNQGHAAQQWSIVAEKGSYRIKLSANMKYCLSVDFNPLCMINGGCETSYYSIRPCGSGSDKFLFV